MSRSLVRNVEDLWDNYKKDKEADYIEEYDFPSYTSTNFRFMIEELEAPKSVKDINGRIIRKGPKGDIVVFCGNCKYENRIFSINVSDRFVRGTKVTIGNFRCKGCGKQINFIRRVVK